MVIKSCFFLNTSNFVTESYDQINEFHFEYAMSLIADKGAIEQEVRLHKQTLEIKLPLHITRRVMH